MLDFTAIKVVKTYHTEKHLTALWFRSKKDYLASFEEQIRIKTSEEVQSWVN